MKCKILYLRHIKTPPCRMFNISIKQNLTWPWTQGVNIHHHNMNEHTVKVCCIVVHNFHVFIYQSSNHIITNQTTRVHVYNMV